MLVTPMVDRSWCHTVGYTSPIAATLALAAKPSPGVVETLVTAGVGDRASVTAVADALNGCDHLIVVGSGADRIAARELTLKIEEAAHIPTAMRDLETFLHGHLPACDERTGLVLIEHDRRRSGPRRELGQMVLQASARVGVRCAVIGRQAPDPGMAAAGYVPTPVADALPAAAEALLATAPAVQWLAHELAVARGVNPDLIRREQEAYREAAKFRGRALHIQNESTDPAGLFVDALEQHGFTVDTLHPYAGDELPASLRRDRCRGRGRRAGRHAPGRRAPLAGAGDRAGARGARSGASPYMGLCLGAQVLTEAAGGTVYRCEPHEIGWHEVDLTPAAAGDALFDGLPQRFQAMQWHYYACRPSNGAVELMTNPVSLQALRVGDAAWGTQFHIEVTRPVLLTWLEMGGDDLAANGYPRDRFLESLDRAPGDPPAGGSHAGRTLRPVRYAASRLSSAAYSGRSARRSHQAAIAGY